MNISLPRHDRLHAGACDLQAGRSGCPLFTMPHGMRWFCPWGFVPNGQTGTSCSRPAMTRDIVWRRQTGAQPFCTRPVGIDTDRHYAKKETS
ncbi:hypothetical protein CFR74_04830 [Novacetimonas hansenii]|nr:hypothetical protein CFR74_04830 [Novacetimonas hansenii]